MKKVFKWVGIVILGIFALLILFAGFVAWKSDGILSHKYSEIEGKNLYVQADSSMVARGQYITETFGGCAACHARNLGGEAIDAMPFAEMNSPNITFGNGGLPPDYSVKDLDLAIRHGVKRDKTGMMMMPSFHLNRLADEDVAALYAYLKQAPRVNNNISPYKLGPIGKLVLAMGGIKPQAEYTDHNFKPKRPEIAPSAEYGRYIAEVTCLGCHGPNYSGGPVFEGDPTWPPATNLTAALTQYDANTFSAFLKTGKRPNGTLIDTRPMPTDIYRAFDETEVAALWAYLSALPPSEAASQTWKQLLHK
jgi:mono/diheme cytochrome c family protein